jgi:hypothetical protein
MQKSSVVDSKTGKSVDSSIRTSFGMFLSRGQDKVVKAIEERIAGASMIPYGVYVIPPSRVHTAVPCVPLSRAPLSTVPARPALLSETQSPLTRPWDRRRERRVHPDSSLRGGPEVRGACWLLRPRERAHAYIGGRILVCVSLPKPRRTLALNTGPWDTAGAFRLLPRHLQHSKRRAAHRHAAHVPVRASPPPSLSRRRYRVRVRRTRLALSSLVTPPDARINGRRAMAAPT